MMGYVNPTKLILAAIPSSNALKKALLKLNGMKESELENKYYYLLSKATMEFIVYLNAEATRLDSMSLAYLAAAGVSVGTTGGGMAFSLASGGISITVPGATAIASGALTVSAGLLSLSAKNVGNIADNALNKAKSDTNKLKEIVTHKVGDKTPKGREFTKHGAEHATERRYSVEDIDDIIDNWTNKGYQPAGKIVYVKKMLMDMMLL